MNKVHVVSIDKSEENTLNYEFENGVRLKYTSLSKLNNESNPKTGMRNEVSSLRKIKKIRKQEWQIG